MDYILTKISQLGIIPVVKIEDATDAVPLAKALIEGGLPVAEITFRTQAAEQAIKNIVSHTPEVLVGAGTVLSTEQAEKAVNAGAKFIVSPGFNPEVVKFCIDKGVPVTPGCSNPTDIEMAIGFGLSVVKFFPAEACGGIKALKSISGPYSGIKFIPTGGINADNLNDYLSFDKILACGGSWMVKSDLIKEGRFDEITKLTKETVKRMLGFEPAHVGINTENEESSLKIAKEYSNLFNFVFKKGNSSNFAGEGIEVNKGKGPGKNGHIAIKTNNITRAISYLQRNGIEIDENTAKKTPNGSTIAVYLKEETGGFAVHLLQKKQ